MSDIRDSSYTRDTFYVLGFAGYNCPTTTTATTTTIKIIPVKFRGFLAH
jgi:hypothetical protein